MTKDDVMRIMAAAMCVVFKDESGRAVYELVDKAGLPDDDITAVVSMLHDTLETKQDEITAFIKALGGKE